MVAARTVAQPMWRGLWTAMPTVGFLAGQTISDDRNERQHHRDRYPAPYRNPAPLGPRSDRRARSSGRIGEVRGPIVAIEVALSGRAGRVGIPAGRQRWGHGFPW
jgi:hypothetical protein